MLKEFVLQRFNKEKAFYNRELLPDGVNHWPRDKVPGEDAYERWFRDVSDPVTRQFYKGKEEIPVFDENGNPKKDELGVEEKEIRELEPYRANTQLVRVKSDLDKEFLYSIGYIVGYTQFGDEIPAKFPTPELYVETTFKHVTRLDPKDNRYKPMTDGPSGTRTHYEMEFNADNVQKLWADRDKKKGCKLTVKDEQSGAVRECPTLDMFINKPFEFIMNADYMTPEEKRLAQEQFEKQQEVTAAKNSKKR